MGSQPSTRVILPLFIPCVVVNIWAIPNVHDPLQLHCQHPEGLENGKRLEKPP